MIESLPFRYLHPLTAGPIEDDPEECRICTVYDVFMFQFSPDAVWGTDEGGDRYIKTEGPHDDAVYFIIDYHQDEDGTGEGEQVYLRCLDVYEIATDVLIGGLNGS